MYKALTSPLMYGSKPMGHLKNKVQKMYNSYNQFLKPLDPQQLNTFMRAVEHAIYVDFLDLRQMINILVDQ